MTTGRASVSNTWQSILANNTPSLELLGVAESPTKFATLDWIDQVDQLGIIAGGMEDGAITLWNVKKILAQSENQQLMGKGCISAA